MAWAGLRRLACRAGSRSANSCGDGLFGGGKTTSLRSSSNSCSALCSAEATQGTCFPPRARFPFFRRTTARYFSSAAPGLQEDLANIRNIGISAHIDSGKTTLTERILYYTGRIQAIHEVRGGDGVGAKMDSMELERQKGITIKSAATYVRWKHCHLNIIDTPGHVDFTIEVERSLRVLDGAIMVLCGVSGVQSQTITVDRQMKRYNVPRLTFINKLDRLGANPWKVIDQFRNKIRVPCAAVQIPVGIESQLSGVVDLIGMKAHYYEGNSGEYVKEREIPEGLLPEAKKKREELLEAVYEADDELAEAVISEGREPTEEELKQAIRRATIKLKFTPVFMGSAYKNKGVQDLLDGVISFLPNPTEIKNMALDLNDNEKEVAVVADFRKPFVGLAFKLEESRFGQLTYMRIYQGQLKKGDTITNTATQKKVKVPRLIRMHSDDMEEINEVGAGEICALFGVECASGTSFTDGTINWSMTSMFIPDPVISLAIHVKDKGQAKNLGKALQRFQREDPTFKVHIDQETNETILSGMGELHLEIYTERMRREYGVDVETGPPRVAYRESLSSKAKFDFTHRKQTGGQGQYARVIGYVEPLDDFDAEELAKEGKRVQFINETIGGSIPPSFIPACEKGVLEAAEKGPLTGHPVQNVRVVINDGNWHPVDSSELAFKTCTINAMRQGMMAANPFLLEPIMSVEVQVPHEFQGTVVGGLNRRKGLILNSSTLTDYVVLEAEVPLSAMVGYATDLRSLTEGKGEFSMEYKRHDAVPRDVQDALAKAYQEERSKTRK